MTALLLFDGDCGFCTSAVEFAHKRIHVVADSVPWQRADLAVLGRTEKQCRESVQYRDRSGRWHEAGRATVAALLDSPPPWSWLGRLGTVPGLAWLVDRMYELVSAYRSHLPGTTPACRRGPG
jgi:predicted DCC family thiol-disulfide oxidoreductase YuxK